MRTKKSQKYRNSSVFNLWNPVICVGTRVGCGAASYQICSSLATECFTYFVSCQYPKCVVAVWWKKYFHVTVTCWDVWGNIIPKKINCFRICGQFIRWSILTKNLFEIMKTISVSSELKYRTFNPLTYHYKMSSHTKYQVRMLYWTVWWSLILGRSSLCQVSTPAQLSFLDRSTKRTNCLVGLVVLHE